MDCCLERVHAQVLIGMATSNLGMHFCRSNEEGKWSVFDAVLLNSNSCLRSVFSAIQIFLGLKVVALSYIRIVRQRCPLCVAGRFESPQAPNRGVTLSPHTPVADRNLGHDSREREHVPRKTADTSSGIGRWKAAFQGNNLTGRFTAVCLAGHGDKK